jgi:hypothetical protein
MRNDDIRCYRAAGRASPAGPAAGQGGDGQPGAVGGDRVRLFVGLVLLSIGAGASNGNVTKAGGWVVLVFAVLAWYHAAGDIIESTFGRKVLPFGPAPVK